MRLSADRVAEELAAAADEWAATAASAKGALSQHAGALERAVLERAGGLRRALSAPSGAEAMCDFCAAPFVHGPAIAPELRRLRAALDRCPADGHVRAAHAQLEAIERELPALSAEIVPLPAGLGSECATLVAAQLARESGFEERRAEAERSCIDAAEHERFARATAARLEASECRLAAQRAELAAALETPSNGPPAG